jgi:hypothetical protein
LNDENLILNPILKLHLKVQIRLDSSE